MQANPDNGWIQIESIRLVGFEFEARRATIGGIHTDYHIMENAAAWSVDMLMIVLYIL
jgi:hypothetical protein